MTETTPVPYLAPGCFGSALLFNTSNMVCAACPFKEECEPVHVEALKAMREEFGIKPPKVIKRNRPAPTDDQIVEDPARMKLPKKVRELLSFLDRESLNIVDKMRSGVNPFVGENMSKRHSFLMVSCHLIMKLNIPVTQKVLSAGLARKMNWADGTADAHARMAIRALEHVGAINNNDGIISVRTE